MKHITVMIKPASSLCDMQCGYCFYNDVAASRHDASLGIMSRDTAAAVINNSLGVLSDGDHITFAFQGGEPALAGLDFFRYFTERVNEISPPKIKHHYVFQTNGLTADDEWCAFLRENNFLMGLSLDGDAALHNKNRADRSGRGTHNRVMKTKKMFDAHGVQYNILCVLTSETARRAKRVWDFIIKENIKHIQFIPCLEPLGHDTSGDVSPASLTPARFYQFYSSLYPLWKRAAAAGNIVNVRLFEDLLSLYIRGRGITCGLSGRCSPQIVVEADGSCYPCDFYVLDEYKTGNLTNQNLKQIFEAAAESDFIKQSKEIPAWCEDCKYTAWCKGGCKRMERAVYGKDCGMRRFLDECLEDLLSCVS